MVRNLNFWQVNSFISHCKRLTLSNSKSSKRTQVKTKHLSQLCACGKSTRFYCICTVGVMRCKDCFIKHCRDHTNQHACTAACPPDCGGAPEVLVEGVELVTTKKRKRNNPTQAIQSRCVVCKAKTCYCCSACGTEKEVALCHVSTGRNCLPIHISEYHHNSKQNTYDEPHHCVNAEPEESSLCESRGSSSLCKSWHRLKWTSFHLTTLCRILTMNPLGASQYFCKEKNIVLFKRTPPWTMI